MFTDVNEVKREDETENKIDTDLESAMDDKYDRLVSGKSKEELIALRNYLAGEDSETSDEEDKPKQKVLKRQY